MAGLASLVLPGIDCHCSPHHHLCSLHLSLLPDGLGYHDDGEYDVGDIAAEEARLDNPNAASPTSKSKTKTSNAMTNEAIKKARRSRAGAKAAEADTGRNASMWDFLNKGGTAVASSAAAENACKGKGKNRKGEDAATAAVANELDGFLDELDDAPVAGGRSRGRHSSGGRRSGAGSSRRRSVGRGDRGGSARKRRAYGSHEPAPRRSGESTSRGRSREPPREAVKKEKEAVDFEGRWDDGSDNDADFGGDGQEVDFGNDNDAEEAGEKRMRRRKGPKRIRIVRKPTKTTKGGFRSGLLEQGGGCVGGLFAAVYWQEAGLGRDENGVGVELLNDEMQCVDFGCGCGVELNRFLQ